MIIAKNCTEMRFPVDISCGSTGGPAYCTNVVVTAAGHELRNINWVNARRKYNISYGIKNVQQFEKLVAFFHNCKGRALGFRFKDWSDFMAHEQIIGIGDGRSKTFQLFKEYRSYLLDDKDFVTCFRKITKPVMGSVKLHFIFPDSVIVDKELKDCTGDAGIDNTGSSNLCQSEFLSIRCQCDDLICNASYETWGKSDILGANVQECNKCMGMKLGGSMGGDAGDVTVDYSTGVISFLQPIAVGVKIVASFEFDIPARFDSDYLPASFEGIGLHGVNNIQVVELKL